jgi:hypothetical protein
MNARKLKIAPFTYTVREVPGLADAGSCWGDHESILLNAEQRPDQRKDTLLHESLHAELRQGLSEQLKDLDKGLEETLCAFLAPRILALLRDNPWLVDYLTS